MVHRRRLRLRRHRRVRQRVVGTAQRPRLNVFRSNKHIYAQVIDDVAGVTLASASTVDRELKGQTKAAAKADAARQIGETVAKRALAQGITQVVFDRGGYVYHGRVAALADGARQGGLRF